MNLKSPIITLFIACSVPCVLNAQESGTIERDYHLVYIELSDNNNRMGLVNNLNNLYNSFTEKDDCFISYISNALNGQFFVGSNRIEELFYLIRDLNTSLPDVDHDLRKITGYWNEEDITWLDKDGITNHIYRSLNIHYFVSPSFYDLSGEYFASKILGVNNINELNGNTGPVKEYFYFNKNDADDEFMAYIERKHQEGLNNSIYRKFITY